MAASTWETRERPILEAVASAEAAAGEAITNLDELAAATGLDRQVVLLGTRALREAAFLDAIAAGADFGAEAHDDFLEIRLLERGRRATQQWPAEDSAAALLELLEQRIAGATDEEEKSRWERLYGAAKSLGGAALKELMIAYIKSRTGL
jgi:hypothetical protein